MNQMLTNNPFATHQLVSAYMHWYPHAGHWNSDLYGLHDNKWLLFCTPSTFPGIPLAFIMIQNTGLTPTSGDNVRNCSKAVSSSLYFWWMLIIRIFHVLLWTPGHMNSDLSFIYYMIFFSWLSSPLLDLNQQANTSQCVHEGISKKV